MALKLQIKSKGVNADYWKIISSSYSVFGNQTSLTLAVYASKEARTEGLNNYLETKTFQFEGFLSQAEMYAKIKESRMEVKTITTAVYAPAVGDELPVLITPAVTEQYEANEFALSEDV